jgi:glucose-1-phosphate adenylyltransferase
MGCAHEWLPGGCMHDQTITFIVAGGDAPSLLPLTLNHPKVLVPFGGVFRILDFVLSNVINSQLRNVYVLTQDKEQQVQSYIGEGWPQLSREFRWDRGEDLKCLAPAAGKQYRASADAVFQNLEVMVKSRAENVLIVTGDLVYQMDYSRLIRQHVDTQADVTIVGDAVYIFKRQELITALRKFVGDGKDHTFETHIIPSLVRAGRAHIEQFSGYWRTINTVDDYHAANMDFLSDRPGFDPYTGSPAVRALSGPKLLQRSRWAVGSRVALGARLVSCKVSHSTISGGVRVENGCEIENSVVLSGCNIGTGSRVRNAILTENVVVPPRTDIGFDLDGDRQKYLITPEGIVVVSPEGDRQQYVQRRCARVATKAHLAVSR